MKIAVDFDETIIEKVNYPCIKYRLKYKCKDTINKYSKQGVKFYLNTSRYGWYFWAAVWFIKKNKLPIKIKLTPYKIQADIYIDDRNIECKNINWLDIDKSIENYIKQKSI